jgi:hypothetical protein
LESKQKRQEFLSVFDEKRLSLARSTAAVISFIPSMENSFSFHCHSNISPVSGGRAQVTQFGVTSFFQTSPH